MQSPIAKRKPWGWHTVDTMPDPVAGFSYPSMQAMVSVSPKKNGGDSGTVALLNVGVGQTIPEKYI